MSDEAIPNIDPEISNESYLRDSIWLLCFLSDNNLKVLFVIFLHLKYQFPSGKPYQSDADNQNEFILFFAFTFISGAWINPIFSRVHATLYVTMLVRRLVRPSVGPKSLLAQLVRALRHVDFNNTPSFSSESYSHSQYYDIPARFEMIPVADFEKKSIFFLNIWWWWLLIVDLDHVANVSHISTQKNFQ